MRIPVGERFEEEARRYALRFSCESCVHFSPERSRCAHEFPTAEHRHRERYSIVIFCKEYENF